MKKVLIPTLLLSLFFSASAFADDIKDKYPSLDAPKYSLSADKIARLDEPWRVSEFNQRFLDPAVSHYDFIETLDDFETTQGKTVKTNTSKAYTLTVKPNKYGFPLGNSVVIIGVRKFDYSTEKNIVQFYNIHEDGKYSIETQFVGTSVVQHNQIEIADVHEFEYIYDSGDVFDIQAVELDHASWTELKCIPELYMEGEKVDKKGLNKCKKARVRGFYLTRRLLLTTPSPVLLQVDSVSIDECANYKFCYDKASKKLKSIKKFNGFVFNAKNTVTNQNEKYICEANTPKTRFPFVCKIVK